MPSLNHHPRRDTVHLRSLNSVALSRTVPFALATNSCVMCVQLWKVSLLHPYVVSSANRE